MQNVGHADLVQTPEGDWAAVYLGARTRGSTPGFHVLGRETFLAGVDWSTAGRSSTRRDSMFPRRIRASSTVHRRGSIRDGSCRAVNPAPSHPSTPAAASASLRRSGHRAAVRACAGPRLVGRRRAAGSGRFSLRVDERHWTGLAYDGERVVAEVRIGEMRQVLATADVPAGEVTLRIQSPAPRSAPVPIGNAGPDDIVLSLVHPDGDEELARLDGRYFSTEVASGFTGRMLALSAVRDDGRDQVRQLPTRLRPCRDTSRRQRRTISTITQKDRR